MSEEPTTPTVEEKLKEFGADDTVIEQVKSLGVTTFEDLAMLNEEDLTNAGMQVIQARKLLASLKPASAATDAATFGAGAVAFDSILPSVPDDESWLKALKAGGVLRVGESTVISAIRAALADRVGLFDVPAKLVAAMEAFADSNDEPVDSSFFGLRKQLTRRSYAEIFEAIDGLDGSYVTDKRKKQLFERIDANLWPAVLAFYAQLKSWQEAWIQQGANPMAMMAALASAGSGGASPLPPGIMQPPDTGVLRDYAEAANDAINRVFSGTNVQVAAALAYDATEIRKTLEDSRLPALIGAANRDQMLKQLKVAVSSTYPRLEQNLTRFVLACMQAQDQPGGNEELQYFGTLCMLGSQIPWSDLGGDTSAVTGIGGDPVRL